MKTHYLMILLLLSWQAFAGERTGNGGDVVICPNSIVLLDYHEAKTKGFTDFLSGPKIENIVKKAVQKIERLDYFIGQEVKETSSLLLQDIRLFEKYGKSQLKNTIFTNEILTDVKDSYAQSLPKDCRLEQLIINKDSPLALQKKFLIQKGFWKKMDLDQKAYAVIHESIYLAFLRRGASDSIFARYLTGILISGASNEYTLPKWLDDQQKELPNASFAFKSFAKDSVKEPIPLILRSEIPQACRASQMEMAIEDLICYEVEWPLITDFELISEKRSANYLYNNYVLIPTVVIAKVTGEIVGYEARPVRIDNQAFLPLPEIELNGQTHAIGKNSNVLEVLKRSHGLFDMGYPLFMLSNEGRPLNVQINSRIIQLEN